MSEGTSFSTTLTLLKRLKETCKVKEPFDDNILFDVRLLEEKIERFNQSAQEQKIGPLKAIKKEITDFIFNRPPDFFAQSLEINELYNAVTDEVNSQLEVFYLKEEGSLEIGPSALGSMLSLMSADKSNDLALYLYESGEQAKKLKAINSEIKEIKLKKNGSDKNSTVELMCDIKLYDLTKKRKTIFKESNAIKVKLRDLYGDEQSVQADRYNVLIRTKDSEMPNIHSIGGNNSLNFLINGEVLKLENTLGESKELELKARNNPSLSPYFTSAETQTPVVIIVGEESRALTLVATQYCDRGSVETVHQSLHKAIAVQKEGEQFEPIFETAAALFSQMAQILSELSQNDIFFPDAKDTNWLVDKDGKLMIADFKSLETAAKGIYHASSKEFSYSGTQVYEPKRLLKDFDVDKFHAYVLAVNLNKFLTNDESLPLAQLGEKGITAFLSKSQSQKTTFAHAVYQKKPYGSLYKELITKLSHLSANKRISCSEAYEDIIAIQTHQNLFVMLKEQLLLGGKSERQADSIIKNIHVLYGNTPLSALTTMNNDLNQLMALDYKNMSELLAPFEEIEDIKSMMQSWGKSHEAIEDSFKLINEKHEKIPLTQLSELNTALRILKFDAIKDNHRSKITSHHSKADKLEGQSTDKEVSSAPFIHQKL